MAGDGLADWLALHGMTAAQMLALVDLAPPPAPAPTAQPDLPLAGEAIWAMAAEALTAVFPDRGDIISRTRDATSRDLCADPARYPRAFTLWEPAYVSAPPVAGIGDLMTVAHEFGHACQIWACRISACQVHSCQQAMPPPILRETAACLAELALLNRLPRLDPSLHAAAQAHFDAATRRVMTAGRQRLERVLQAGSGTYRYAWNYPPARAAALMIWARPDRSRQWGVFDGTLRLASLRG